MVRCNIVIQSYLLFSEHDKGKMIGLRRRRPYVQSEIGYYAYFRHGTCCALFISFITKEFD